MRLTAQQLTERGYCPETGRRVSRSRVSGMTPSAAPAKTRVMPVAPAAGESPALKYRNEPTLGPDPCGGTRRYSSKREARRAKDLAAMKRGGEIADFYPQVSVPYGVDETGKALRYVADFLVVAEYRADGMLVGWLEDPKGHATERSTAKMAALRARGLNVKVI